MSPSPGDDAALGVLERRGLVGEHWDSIVTGTGDGDGDGAVFSTGIGNGDGDGVLFSTGIGNDSDCDCSMKREDLPFLFSVSPARRRLGGASKT